MTVSMKLKSLATYALIAFTAIALLATASSRPVSAMELVARGDTIFLAGPIKPGDSIEFTNFIKQAPKGAYKAVFLSSGGGFVTEAVDIGRIIRQQGMATIVDAGHSICASACTAIFASGIKRIYLNATALTDGLPTKHCAGLGFHNGSSATSMDANHFSGQASALMIDAFYEFGVPKAAALISKAQPNEIYQLSGQSALTMGIATSLTRS